VRYEEFQKEAFEAQRQRGIEDPETKRLWEEAERAYAEYEQHGGAYGAPYNPSAPGYTLRSDIPRRPDAPEVRTSTIAESPRLIEARRVLEEATERERVAEDAFRVAEAAHDAAPNNVNWRAYLAAEQEAAEVEATHQGRYVTDTSSTIGILPNRGAARTVDPLGAVNRALGQGVASAVSGGVGAQVNQEMNPDDPYAAIKGFAVGALGPLAATRGVRAGLRAAGKAGPEAEGALATFGASPNYRLPMP
jgi:hypothetical protein